MTPVRFRRRARSKCAQGKRRKCCVKINDYNNRYTTSMLFSKEYVGYLAREVTKKLIEGEFIETPDPRRRASASTRRCWTSSTLEDRINDEVRIILDTYSDEMRRSGANYQEMFKKVKNELVRKYKAVL